MIRRRPKVRATARLYQMLELKKPAPRDRQKRRETAEESAVKRASRARCEERDGRCRLYGVPEFGPCRGRSEWNHFLRRSKTRNRPPQERHGTQVTGMLCERHHDLVDEHGIEFRYLTAARADGPMGFRRAGVRRWYREAGE